MTLKVAYITTARSDYGPGYWLIHDLCRDKRLEVFLIVGGSHLSERHGQTVTEIEKDGWPIVARVPFLDSQDDEGACGRAAGKALAAYADLFAQFRPDIAVVYGDRYELLPIATAAVVTGTPLAHVCGGDLTEGAIDDQVRHAVTKLAHLHFPSTAQAARRILQMGEEPWRVHLVGDPALDHFFRGAGASSEEVAGVLGFAPNQSTLLVTFHPTTLELEDTTQHVIELASALYQHRGHIVITAPGPDLGGEVIRAELERLAQRRPGTVFMESLGSYQYRGLLHLVGAMVGNSSSGLIEAACVPVPAVNIGNRQKGREHAANVIHVPPERQAITAAIDRALSPQFRASLSELRNPYGDGRAACRIVERLASLTQDNRLFRKSFHHWFPLGRSAGS